MAHVCLRRNRLPIATAFVKAGSDVDIEVNTHAHIIAKFCAVGKQHIAPELLFIEKAQSFACMRRKVLRHSPSPNDGETMQATRTKPETLAHYLGEVAKLPTPDVQDSDWGEFEKAAADIAPPKPRRISIDLGDIREEIAREHVLADLDTFTDGLGAACMGVSSISSEYETRTLERLESAPTPTVLHALLIAGQKGDARIALAAAKILGDRYVDSQRHRVDDRIDLMVAMCGGDQSESDRGSR